MNINIRFAKAEDYDSLIEVLRQVHEVHLNERPDVFKTTDTPMKREELDDMLSSSKKLLFVAEDFEGKIIAYSSCLIKNYEKNSLFKPFRSLRIDNFGVREEYRGKGVGTALFEHIKGYARENGFYRIDLSVWAFNTEAVEFYKACSMKEQSITMEYILEGNL